MKFRTALLSLLLACPAGAQEGLPPLPGEPGGLEENPLPFEEPRSPAGTGRGPHLEPGLPGDSEFPGNPEVPREPGLPPNSRSAPGLVPGVRLLPGDKVGRTYAEGSPFNIWGGTRMQRSSLFTAAGVVRKSMLDALRLPDEWTNPIVIQLREPLASGTDQRAPVWTAISQVEGGFRLEINLVPRRQSVPGPLLQENLVRAMLADRVLKGKQGLNLTGEPTPPPDWLLHGTLALMEYRQLGRMSGTFSRIFQLGRVLSVQDILNADPDGMDSVSLTIYRVSCGGLLMMLIEQPKGGEQLARLLPTLAHGGTDHAVLIERAFPELTGSSNSLSKWWSLQIAALSQPGMEEVQAPAETERLLAEALVLRYNVEPPAAKKPGALKRLFTREKAAVPSANANAASSANAAPSAATGHSCDITDYAKVLALPDPAPSFNQVDLSLTRLMLRAHPVYRPIIQEYQDAVRGLAKKKAAKNLPDTFARLATTRTRLAATVQGIENHLDWYEATQSNTPSDAFDGYLKAADDAEKPAPPRTDPLSRYLDEVEAEYTR